MTSISARGLRQWLLDHRDLAFVCILTGDNEELKADLFRDTCDVLDISVTDPFRFVRLNGETLESDPSRLVDELSAISMFGGSRLIQIKTSAHQSERAIRQALATPRGNWFLLVDSQDLGDADWVSGLHAEKGLAVVACGAEGSGNFHNFVAGELTRAGLTFDRAAIENLIALTGEDRASVRGEIIKFVALLGSGGHLDAVTVRDVVADASSTLAEEVAAAAFAGDCGALARLLDRIAVTGSDPGQALGAAHRHALNLSKASNKQWNARRDPHAPAWSAADIRSLARALGASILQCRSYSPDAALIAERTLLALGQSARLKKR